MQPETLVSAVNKAMRAHGYAMVSTAQPINFDGYAIRFVVAGDNVLAERLKPIVISVSSLDLMTVTDPKSYAKRKADEAIENATK